MEITLPDDCGNAPRIDIVGEFTVNWAKGDADAVSGWLADDAVWTVVGKGSRSGTGAARASAPPFVPERVRITSIITHGRHASCDGYIEAGDSRIDFSHVFRFTGAAKTAKIAQLRSYCIESGGSFGGAEGGGARD